MKQVQSERGEAVDPRELLESLRWKEDQLIVNDFGETVWLKARYLKGKRIGITDCCFVEDPCDWHKSLAENIKQKTPRPVPTGVLG